MESMMKQIHGSNLKEISRQYGISENEILDFSSNINPLGTPKPAFRAIMEEMDRLIQYPERDSLTLRESLAARDRVHVDNIIAGNGSTEFIYLIPRVLQMKKVLLLAPTYSDYELALTRSGSEVVHFPLKKEEGFAFDLDRFIKTMQEGVGLVFLCNPNNPTGTLIHLEEIKEILSASRFTKTTVVIDEAFMDFVLGESVRFQVVEWENLLVLRSLTSFYGIPGLRAGALYGSTPLIEKIKAYQEPWTLNRLSQAAVMAVFDDEDYRQESIHLVREQRDYLIRELGAVPGIRVFPSSANYLLLETSPPMPEPDRLFDSLIRSGILVRNCASFPTLGSTFIRVAVRNYDENMLLVEALNNAVRKLE
jgi:threonine-phosphate decarboxylase